MDFESPLINPSFRVHCAFVPPAGISNMATPLSVRDALSGLLESLIMHSLVSLSRWACHGAVLIL
jgi:hypothetical protein